MIPLPPRIGSLIRGAEITSPSRTIARRRPAFFDVMSPNRAPPAASKRNETTGRPSLKVGWESIRLSPETTTRRSIRYSLIPAARSPASADGRIMVPGGMPVARAWEAVFSSFTRWKFIFAVRPRIARKRDGSSSPGT